MRPSQRANVRRLEHAFENSDHCREILVQKSNEIDEGFEHLVNLHQRRRKSIGELGCFSSERFTAFHRDMIAQFFDLGALCLTRIEIDQRPVAAEYAFTGGDVTYYYQGGFEPEAASCSPGWLQLMASIRAAIDRGSRYYDFLRGDEPYKRRWGAVPIPLECITVFNNGFRSRIRGQILDAASKGRAFLRGSKALARSRVKARRKERDF
jgi:CelD/BcsL family acetyltransferase involved in cellulose biosynthesis